MEAQLSGEADAGNHPTSYAESGLDTQLSIDVGGGTYTATFPFFLAPEPDTALLGAVAAAALAGKRVNRARSAPKRSKADRAAGAVPRPLPRNGRGDVGRAWEADPWSSGTV